MPSGFLFVQGKGSKAASGEAHVCPPQGVCRAEGGECGGHGIPGDAGGTLPNRWMTNDTLHRREVSGMVCADGTRPELLPSMGGTRNSYRSVGTGSQKVTDLRPWARGEGTRSRLGNLGDLAEMRPKQPERTRGPGKPREIEPCTLWPLISARSL